MRPVAGEPLAQPRTETVWRGGMPYLVIGVIVGVVAPVLSYFYFKSKSDRDLLLARQQTEEAEKVTKNAIEQAEARKREALLAAKDEAYKLRGEMEQEIREQRGELQRLERRLAQKEETLDRRLESLDGKERDIQYREGELDTLHKE